MTINCTVGDSGGVDEAKLSPIEKQRIEVDVMGEEP